MELIAQGAEAKIYFNASSNIIVKTRESKNYRLKELDDELISSRTRREAKIMNKLKNIAPKVFKTTNNTIEMEFIKGALVKEILDEKPVLAKQIANSVSIMHDKNIVHGDLTTGNMVYGDSLKIIDFGLAKVSTKQEDKAVDLHLFHQSLESKHFKVKNKVWEEFLKHYNVADKEEVLKRLEKVQLRGKNKK